MAPDRFAHGGEEEESGARSSQMAPDRFAHGGEEEGSGAPCTKRAMAPGSTPIFVEI